MAKNHKTAGESQPKFSITSLSKGTLQPQGAFQLFGEMRDEVISHQPAVGAAFESSLEKGLSLYEGAGADLWVMMAKAKPASCVGVKPLTEDSCELKRLFIRPEFRGLGLSRQLLELAIPFAKAAGYRAMYLDTLWEFQTAQQLYKKYGFQQIPPYNDTSADIACHMKLSW